MIERVVVTPENQQLCARVLDALQRRRVELRRTIRRHPLECTFGDFRVVLWRSFDVDRLIEQLQQGLVSQEQLHSSGSRARLHDVTGLSELP